MSSEASFADICNLLTRNDFPWTVSNATDSSNFLTENNCDSIEDDSAILDQNYVLHDGQVPQYQMLQQQSVYNNFPFFGDGGYNDDAEFTPHDILPVIDSSMTWKR